MDFDDKKTQIFKYLDKNYIVKEKLFFNINDNKQEWGIEIHEQLPLIFSFDKNLCGESLLSWSNKKGINGKTLSDAWSPKRLKASWNPEMAQDLTIQYHVDDAESHVIALLLEQLLTEIESEDLRLLKNKIKTGDDLFSVLRCIGYEVTPSIIEMETFIPKKYFMSLKYHEMIYERENNNIWQNYIRPTRVNQKT